MIPRGDQMKTLKLPTDIQLKIIKGISYEALTLIVRRHLGDEEGQKLFLDLVATRGLGKLKGLGKEVALRILTETFEETYS
jgi:hypothetical protein